MVRCRFPSISRAAASRSEFRCPQNISPFQFLGHKISFNSLNGGNNAGLFSFTPIIKRVYVKMTVFASSSAANRRGMDEEDEGISSKLVERDRYARNLGEKLEVIRDLVAEHINDGNCLEALACSAIYLKWLNTGQIPWSKDGEPNQYTEILWRIYRHLEIICSRKDTSVEEILVIRKIHCWLASLKAEFTTFVPRTRIEDGVHQELKELFNGWRRLEEPLESVKELLDQSSIPLRRFLEANQQLDNIKDILDIGNGEWMTRLMNILQALDNLRQEIVKGLESKLRYHAPDAAIVMRLKRRLCEIGLEDYSSLLLSRFLVSLEAVGGARWLAKNVEQKNVGSWNEPLGALIISIRQLGLSGWKPEECRAITNELKAWQENPPLETEGGEDGTRIWGLRLKATLDRADRLTEEYSEALLNIFPEKVEILGKAFGIPDKSVKTHTEAEICAGLIFQVSNLCTLLLKAVRKVVDARGWDILVPGAAVGKLIQVENIGSIPSSETLPLIVVINNAEGDEEVKAAEAEIGAVILLQGLPRLSNLVFRARKENIVVITCEDEEEFFRIRSLSGEVVSLAASSSDGVSLKTPDSSPSTPSFSSLPRNLSNADSTESEPYVKASEIYRGVLNGVGAVRIEDAENLARKARVRTENICGAKAASCCRLASLAAQFVQEKNEAASFKVPKGAVIPFGSIRGALDRDVAKSRYYWSLVNSLERATSQDEIRRLREELHKFVSLLSPSEKTIRELLEILPHDTVLILRPSASVEDLRGSQVIGRDEPIPDPSLLRDAISRVWASLYTPEAFRSRRAARVGERDADVAVLVQEMPLPNLSFMLRIVGPTDENSVAIEMVDGATEDFVEVELEMDESEGLMDIINIKEGNDERKNTNTIEVHIAPGLQEAPIVNTRASPWRLSYDGTSGTVETIAFANFSEDLEVPSCVAPGGQDIKLTVDYSKEPLTTNALYRQQLGRRLGAVGLFLAEKFRGRWDIEGCLLNNDIYIVQMHPRP